MARHGVGPRPYDPAMDVVDLADQMAAAADLNDQARGRVEMELEFGDAEYVICICLLETRTPFPAALLAQIRARVPN